MRLVILNSLDTGHRIKAFLDHNGVAIGSAVPPNARKALDEAVDKLVAFQLEQSRAREVSRSETAIQIAKRRTLYRMFLAPIRRIAQRHLHDTPEIATLCVPALAARRGDFLRMALNAAGAASMHEQVLVDHGMPEGFAKHLQDAIAELEDSAAARDAQWTRASSATAGLAATESALRCAVSVIDGLLTEVLDADASLKGGWRVARRFRRTAVATAAPAEATVTPTSGGATGAVLLASTTPAANAPVVEGG